MPAGPCPATWQGGYTRYNGDVTVEWTVEWDGTSTREADGCKGTIVRIFYVNRSTTQTYQATFVGRRGQPITVTAPPGDTRTVTSPGQLRQLGFETSEDLEGLDIVPIGG